MDKKDHVRLSKRMSYVLRHHPEEFGLVLREGGWAEISDLAKAMGVTTAYIREIVETSSDKVRFTYDDKRNWIRAAQGHSIEVDLKLEPREPLDMLFHGTYVGALGQIFEHGLKRMRRTHVHLSKSSADAIEVGARRGKPVLIQVDAIGAYLNGVKFYLADNGVWLSDDIPPEYLTATYVK